MQGLYEINKCIKDNEAEHARLLIERATITAQVCKQIRSDYSRVHVVVTKKHGQMSSPCFGTEASAEAYMQTALQMGLIRMDTFMIQTFAVDILLDSQLINFVK